MQPATQSMNGRFGWWWGCQEGEAENRIFRDQENRLSWKTSKGAALSDPSALRVLLSRRTGCVLLEHSQLSN